MSINKDHVLTVNGAEYVNNVVNRVFEKVRRCMRIYLVGGALRDAFMGRALSDRDYVVLEAGKAAFMQQFPGAKRIGGALGIYVINGCEYTRSDAVDIESDLRTRDLTINAMAREVFLQADDDAMQRQGKIIAHPKAMQDIAARILRPVAVENFVADPCRTIRAARFAATLPGFSAGPGLFVAMRAGVAHGLNRVAAERIGYEVRKACAGVAPARFLSFLHSGGCFTNETGWFAPFVLAPELTDKASSLMQNMAGILLRARSGVHSLPPKRDAAAMGVYMAMCRHMGPTVAYDFGVTLKLPGTWIRAGRDAAALLESIRGYATLSSKEKISLLLYCHRTRLAGLMTLLAMAQYGVAAHEATGEIIRKDLQTILNVRLPAHQQGKGRSSGRALSRLRMQALEN